MTDQAPPPPGVGGARHPALTAVRRWAQDTLRPALCMVTGSPATGKSQLIAELMADDTPAARFNAFVPLRGMTPASATWALAGQLRLPGETPDSLLGALSIDARRATIVVPALDESGVLCDGADAEAIVRTLLRPLSEIQHVRLLVEGRPEALAAFPPHADVVNLDDPQYTDQAAFTAWLQRTAAAMRLDPRVVAAAARHYPNMGLAELALRAGPGDDLVGRWLRLVPPQAWPALDALASAYEEIDADTWFTWTRALTGDPERARAAVIAVMPLVRRAGDGHLLDCRPVREAIRRARTPQVTAQIDRVLGAGMYAAVPQSSGRPDWARASGYVQRHLARHAVESGVAEGLLTDTGFLVHADPISVAGALETVRLPGRPSDAWRTVGAGMVSATSAAERAAVLHLGALLESAESLADDLQRFSRHAGRVPAWANGSAIGHGWPGEVAGLALGTEPEVLHCAAVDGPVHTFSTTDGRTLGRTPAKAGTAHGLVPFADGGLLRLDASGALHRFGPGADERASLLTRLDATRTAPWTALGADPAASTIVLGDRAGGLRAVRPDTDDPPDEIDTASGPVQAVTCIDTPSGRVAPFGGADGAVRVWNVGGGLLDRPLVQRPSAISAVAAVLLPDGPAFAAGWVDGWVWFWRTSRREARLSPLGFPIRALAIGRDETLYAGGSVGVVALRPGHPATGANSG
ncbi:hypothetical protein [Actinomadura sp. WMMB 499]|uniref:hypothetical protein n=1 Tax=Actinomadura sp. WMMB 499 TaxID=1219491 RepID=UPI001245B7CA|nr:hypothetical protein [Actinomadura sp. WMMB 499]QFG22482.1 hypothetical protein F7P10_16475 [Actinomadura sp. WMMB 499]